MTSWSTTVQVPAFVLVLLAVAVVIQVLVIWSIRRHREPKLKLDCDLPIERLLPSFAGLSLGSIVLMPSTSGSDNPMVQHAAHRNFEKLLRCGVRLFEYPHTLLHQKVMTVDGVWCAVGSSSYDDRSFETNDEITVGIRDRATTERLDAIFGKYLPTRHGDQARRMDASQRVAQAQGPHVLPDQRDAVAHLSAAGRRARRSARCLRR